MVRTLTGGSGADVVLDFVGSDETLSGALAAVAPEGLVVVVGLLGGAVPFSFFSQAPEATLTTSYWGTRNELAELVALAEAGRVACHVERHPLDEINTVFTRLSHGEIDGRAVLVP